MSTKLDDELANAIQPQDEARGGSTPPVARPANAARAPAPRRSIGLLATLLVMVGAVIALFLVGFKEAAVYATTVDKLMESKESVGRKLRVEGELVPGTLEKRDQPCEYRFKVHGQKAEVPVRYAQCVIPDTFRDVPGGGVQVTVEGSLNASGNFEASLVMAKCASKYDPSTHKMNDGQAANALPVN